VREGSELAVGLDSTNAAAGWQTLDYALVVTANNQTKIYENGVEKWPFATGLPNTFTAGTNFIIQRDPQGNISFLAEEGDQGPSPGSTRTLYYFSVPSIGALQAEVSLKAQNSELLWGQIDTGDLDQDGISDDVEREILGSTATWVDLWNLMRMR
jgi:hypothetical protein